MLFNTYKSYPFSADYYSYTLITSADGTVTERRYATIPVVIKANVSTSYSGELIIITKEKLQKSGYLKNVKDRNGNEIYVNGVWEITQTMPTTLAVGLVEAYKYRAKIISGDV